VEKVYEYFIACTPGRLWDAITNPATQAHYSFGSEVTSEWTAGSPLVITARGGDLRLAVGDVLEAVPPKRLMHTLAGLWSHEVRAAGASRVTWEIEPVVAESCRLVVTHDHLRYGDSSELYRAWPMILSGLKTWVECGRVLTTPGSLRRG